MRIIVIGSGSIGKRHIGNLFFLGQEVAAYNRGKTRRNEAAERFGIPVFDDLDEALDTWGATAAVIAPDHVDRTIEGHAVKPIRKRSADGITGFGELEEALLGRILAARVIA